VTLFRYHNPGVIFSGSRAWRGIQLFGKKTFCTALKYNKWSLSICTPCISRPPLDGAFSEKLLTLATYDQVIHRGVVLPFRDVGEWVVVHAAHFDQLQPGAARETDQL